MAKKSLPKFIGREKEHHRLKWLSDNNTASLVVITGRRRIGKSRLIAEYAASNTGRKKATFIEFTGLAPSKINKDRTQLEEFSRQVSNAFNEPGIQFCSWGDAFEFVGRRTATGRYIILLDEISWMGSDDTNFMGRLKITWDLYFSRNSELMLVLCGSVSAWIESYILSSAGFVGRISRTMRLQELPLHDCVEFWQPHKERSSDYDKLKLLAVTGGVPRYLEEVRADRSADENIHTLCFMPDGMLVHEYRQIFKDTLLRRSDVYQRIVEVLADGTKTAKALAEAVGANYNNSFSEYLHELTLAGFIARDFTWHFKSGKLAKLSRYRLKDNYLRFYLKCIAPSLMQIERGDFEELSQTNLPGWQSMMGLQFENLVINNRRALLRALHIDPTTVQIDNPYFQTATQKQPGCQIDYLIQTKTNVLYLCEIKFAKQPLDTSVMDEMERKISALKIPRGFSYQTVLIHVNGISDALDDKQYFNHIILFGELLKK